MKKRSAAKAKRDAQVLEFDTKDLGGDIRTSRAGRVLRRGASKPTSILLDTELVERLREAGAKRGLGYQTMLKVIVREHIDEY